MWTSTSSRSTREGCDRDSRPEVDSDPRKLQTKWNLFYCDLSRVRRGRRDRRRCRCRWSRRCCGSGREFGGLEVPRTLSGEAKRWSCCSGWAAEVWTDFRTAVGRGCGTRCETSPRSPGLRRLSGLVQGVGSCFGALPRTSFEGSEISERFQVDFQSSRNEAAIRCTCTGSGTIPIPVWSRWRGKRINSVLRDST